MRGLAVALAVFLSLEARAGQPRFIKLKPLEARVIAAVKTRTAEPQAAGTHRPIEARSLDKGQWKKLSNGARVWRLGIESPGAAGLRVRFTAFDAGAGKLWLHAPGEVAGPYTGRGPHGDGDFWSEVVFSSRVIIEYQPAGPARSVPFRVPEISHLIRR